MLLNRQDFLFRSVSNLQKKRNFRVVFIKRDVLQNFTVCTFRFFLLRGKNIQMGMNFAYQCTLHCRSLSSWEEHYTTAGCLDKVKLRLVYCSRQYEILKSPRYFFKLFYTVKYHECQSFFLLIWYTYAVCTNYIKLGRKPCQ